MRNNGFYFISLSLSYWIHNARFRWRDYTIRVSGAADLISAIEQKNFYYEKSKKKKNINNARDYKIRNIYTLFFYEFFFSSRRVELLWCGLIRIFK